MERKTVGIISPGSMGATLGGSLAQIGHEVLFCGAGRSEETKARAAKYQIRSVATLSELANRCQAILSVCPPARAMKVAHEISILPGSPLFVDANAVAESSALAMADLFGNAKFVDACIIGPPVQASRTTTLWLSGSSSGAVVDLFRDSNVITRELGNELGKASTLKMAVSAATKALVALSVATYGLAESRDVLPEFVEILSQREPRSIPDIIERIHGVVPKAHRFVGEMLELENALQAARLADGFGTAAAEVFGQLKDPSWRQAHSFLGESSRRIRGDSP